VRPPTPIKFVVELGEMYFLCGVRVHTPLNICVIKILQFTT
jgi:hypothetical protein